MTLEESLNQKLAAAATLRFLAMHGSTSFRDLQHELICYDRQTLMRGVVLAESLGGMCISIDKRQLGEVHDFDLVKVSHKVKQALKVLERQLWFCAQRQRAAALSLEMLSTAEAV